MARYPHLLMPIWIVAALWQWSGLATALDICRPADANALITAAKAEPQFTSCNMPGLVEEFARSADKEMGSIIDLYDAADGAAALGNQAPAGPAVSTLESELPEYIGSVESVRKLLGELQDVDWTNTASAQAALQKGKDGHDLLRHLVEPLAAKPKESFSDDKRLTFCLILFERGLQKVLFGRLMACSKPP